MEILDLLRRTNEHKFSFRWVERQKVSGHPGLDVENCILKLDYCSGEGFMCNGNKYLSVISTEVMN